MSERTATLLVFVGGGVRQVWEDYDTVTKLVGDAIKGGSFAELHAVEDDGGSEPFSVRPLEIARFQPSTLPGAV